MSSVLSKQTGSKPSSRQHLMEESPLVPPPITATLFFVMVSRGLPAWVGAACPKERMTKDKKHTSVSSFQGGPWPWRSSKFGTRGALGGRIPRSSAPEGTARRARGRPAPASPAVTALCCGTGPRRRSRRAGRSLQLLSGGDSTLEWRQRHRNQPSTDTSEGQWEGLSAPPPSRARAAPARRHPFSLPRWESNVGRSGSGRTG